MYGSVVDFSGGGRARVLYGSREGRDAALLTSGNA